MERKFTLVRPDGLSLFGLRWTPEPGAGEADFHVFLGHSHVVHAGALRPLAEALAAAGCTVTAGDIRGHGRSVGPGQPRGHLEGARGWRAACGDFVALAQEAFAGVPFEKRLLVVPNILALLALEALKTQPDLAARIVLIAPPPNQPALARLGAAFAAARARLRPAQAPDPQLLHHIYSYLGAQLPNRRHLLDVVSPEAGVIRAILDDPLSWAVPSTAYWQAIFHGLATAWAWPRRHRLHPETRFLILYGQDDPMTGSGAFCGPIFDHLTRHGAREVCARGVAGARTGIFLEEERLGIAARILGWAQGGGAASDLKLPRPRSMTELMRERSAPDALRPGVLSPEECVELCYAGIEDETRWIEILTRILATADEGTEEELMRFLGRMMPHWDRAFGLQQQILTHAALGDVWGETLERMGLACALIDGRGKVLHANARYGAALARLAGDLPAPGAGAQSEQMQLDRMTQALVAASVAGGQGPLAPQGALLHWEGEPVGFFFRPPALETHARQLGNPVGLVVLRGEGAGEAARLALVQCGWGLTPAEAQVALCVMRGAAPGAIAAELGVSINTVRSHLAQLYAKTETPGKAELAARLHASPLGWAAGAAPAGADWPAARRSVA